jgi:hypothetical protein
MNKLNKGLLIGNIVLVLVVLSFVLTACTSSGQISALQQTDATLTSYINQLQNKVTADEAVIAQLQAQIAADKSWAQSNFDILFTAINAR